MGKKYFLLGTVDNNQLINLIRILFGIVCFAVAIFWLLFNVKSITADGTIWITIIFLSGFGFYQIWSGLGRAVRFIEIGHDKIRLRKNPLLHAKEMVAEDIEKIELFPLNVIFFLKTQNRILLRFGTTYIETSENIKEAILGFAKSNNIPLEIIEEKI